MNANDRRNEFVFQSDEAEDIKNDRDEEDSYGN